MNWKDVEKELNDFENKCDWWGKEGIPHKKPKHGGIDFINKLFKSKLREAMESMVPELETGYYFNEAVAAMNKNIDDFFKR